MEIRKRWMIPIAVIIGILMGFYAIRLMELFYDELINHPGIPLIPGIISLLPFLILVGLFIFFVNTNKTTKQRVLDNILFIVFQIIGLILFFIFLVR
tara:strand:+ start:227 stop:517 length:291 start_codon:yes stop_codon:yes gene_type:complete